MTFDHVSERKNPVERDPNTPPQHSWIVTEPGGKRMPAKRHCPICGLVDNTFTSDDPWRHEGTICIEPVPDEVSFDTLLDELRQHLQTKNCQPYAMGYPGKWHVGFFSHTNYAGTELNPAVLLTGEQMPEHGWAWLLRYTRLRLANPKKSYYMGSKGQITLDINPGSKGHNGCCNDDD